MKACCSGCSAGACASLLRSAYQAARPSRVVSDLSATAATGVTQERISTPSASTEQEPHCASPQPKRGPCRRSSLVRTERGGVSGLALPGPSRPFTLILRSSAIGPLHVEAQTLGGVQISVPQAY